MDNFVVVVFILVLLGIAKDVVISVEYIKKRLQSYLTKNGAPKAPPSLETLTALLRAQSEVIGEDIKGSIDVHFQSLLTESKKTNELLFKFLFVQKMISKANGLDLGDI